MAKFVLKRSPLVSDPIYLKKSDPSGTLFVRFREPTRADDEALNRWWASTENTLILDVEKRALATVLCECNAVDEDKNLYFEPGKSCIEKEGSVTSAIEQAFAKSFEALPGRVAEEILDAMREFYKPYDWRNPRALGE